jgi:tetratricopeptide (TPR) repeat protein
MEDLTIRNAIINEEKNRPVIHSQTEVTTASRLTHICLTQNVLVIWLDSNIDAKKDIHCRDTITQLRCVINNINTFTDGDECIKFLNSIKNEKACLIISGALGRPFVPLVHNMSQIDSIFIYCGNKKVHEQWAKDWSKIRGVLTDISPICQALKQVAERCEHNAMPISFVPQNRGVSNKRLDHLNPLFIYTQVLKEILLSVTFDEEDIQKFIDYCRQEFAGNVHELNNIKKLESKYRDETPVWWYTYECFLYPLLNRSLRTMEVDIIVKMGFFVSDLHQYIKKLHTEQFRNVETAQLITVYRGQGVSKADFDQMMKAKGGLMSFNNFVSTTKNRNSSDGSARIALNDSDLIGIHFVMTIDPSIMTAPFASIIDPSDGDKEKDEVLFSIHTVFRICDIKSMGENNRLWEVDLTLIGEDDPELCAVAESINEELTEGMQEEMEGPTGWNRLGLLLLKLRQPDKAQQIFQMVRKKIADEHELAAMYHGLAQVKEVQGEYINAIIFYEKALEIRERTLPPDHPHLASTYMNTGNMYVQIAEYSKAPLFYEKALDIWQKTFLSDHLVFAGCYMGIGELDRNIAEYSKALLHYEKALDIWQITLPPDHPDLAMAYVTIGNLHNYMGDYPEALSYCEKAFEIIRTTLPADYPDFAMFYRAIGNAHDKMGEYLKAFSYYEKALEIFQKNFSSNHPYLGAIYDNIGEVYRNIGEYSKALTYYEKALDIRQKSLPPNHPDLATTYNNIGGLYSRKSDYLKTLSYCEKALQIGQKSLPADHPILAVSYNSIGGVYSKMGEYSEALSYYEEALEIRQKTLPPNHLDLAISYSSIGLIYDNMGDYSKALSSHKKALEIQEHILPPNDLRLATAYNNMGLVYDNMGDYSKALSYYEKDLEISEKKFPRHHPDLATSYNNIGLVYDNIGDYSKALSSHEKALEIYQKTLSENHPHLATSYNNIGLVYDKLGEYSKALSSHEKALKIREKSLPFNHPDLATSYNNIGLVYDNIRDYKKALSCFQRAVDIGQCSLSENHPCLQLWKNNFESVKKKCK